MPSYPYPRKTFTATTTPSTITLVPGTDYGPRNTTGFLVTNVGPVGAGVAPDTIWVGFNEDPTTSGADVPIDPGATVEIDCPPSVSFFHVLAKSGSQQCSIKAYNS